MAAPYKVVKTKGKWKNVEIDPNLLTDSKFSDLISFEELTDYEIVDEHTKKATKTTPTTKSTNVWKITEGPASIKDKNVEKISPVVNEISVDGTHLSRNTKKSGQIVKRNRLNKKGDDPPDKLLDDGSPGDAQELGTKNHVADQGDKPNDVSRVVNSRKRKSNGHLCGDDSCKDIKLDDEAGVFNPGVDMSTWEGLYVPVPVLKALSHRGFSSPTPIQALTLPPAIRDGQDIMGAAETGSGKTLAFGIPMLHYILKWKDIESRKASSVQQCDGVKSDDKSQEMAPLLGLVLTPTRELAVQVKNHIEVAAKFTDIQVAVLLGGMSAQKQQRILKRRPEIVIATPGRLWELIQMDEPHVSQLDQVVCLVIDEADRMVEKGHFEELGKLLDLLNENKERARRRHTYVYSATLTMKHTGHGSSFRKKKAKTKETNQLEVLMGRVGMRPGAKVIDLTNKSITADTLVETKINCAVHEKDMYLYYFITHHPGRTLVFTNSKDCIRRLVSVFTHLSCNPLPLHADMHQKQRLKNLERFTANERVLLLATDVAARGLDIPDVQHVIHYQVPRTVENYVHRSGRTARVCKEGLSVMLVGADDVSNYRKIVLQVSKGEDLPMFPVDSHDLSRIKPRVDMAQQIDRLEHRSNKMKRENNWFIKAARDMDMELDDDHEILHNFKPKHENAINKKLKIMKGELAKMLRQAPGSGSFVGRYPTHTGRLHDPRVMAPKGDAVSQVKKHLKNTVKEDSSRRQSGRRRHYKRRRVSSKT